MVFAKNFIKKMQTKLLAEKKRIENDLADFTTKSSKGNKVVFPDYGDHSDENAGEVATFDNIVALKNTLEKELRDIEAALQRLKGGSYGTCKYCKKEITPQRLQIRPTSSACVECKKRLSGED